MNYCEEISYHENTLWKDDSIQSIAQELDDDECIQVKKTFESKIKHNKVEERKVSDKMYNIFLLYF